MSKIIIYPVGNGDTSQIILANGRRLLFDFRHKEQGKDTNSPVIDLKKRLKEELQAASRDDFDVFALTHGDDDHLQGSTEFFELWHAEKYQSKDRIKIGELWVPAAMILETAPKEKQGAEKIIWRQEARHRLLVGKGIRVFSKPELIREWLESQGVSFETRKHLFVDAGKVVPGFTLANDEVEFFCHSPFMKHVDDKDIQRNEAALIFQVRFVTNGTTVDYFAIGDSTYTVLEEIVSTSNYHGNQDRLNWDILNVPHHCSYSALGPEKGDKETSPTPGVEELLLHGQREAYAVSSSNPIVDTAEAYSQEQPPHIQARKCYERHLKEVDGRKFLVTIEEPNARAPKPLEFEITGNGCRWLGAGVAGASIITSTRPPRAGKCQNNT